ncbi:type II toxin-antitoxin system VapC family toxin [Mucilaginibacter sp.]|uniref:type II toxin-antitoxin system VapC family toxin n=1 Tax=Mucilaginibacter sp. TaxID=1882438 RepID=UPI00284B6950|nr:type II toxin-antitoxin system VapC family toxin [Mucilaginibacter sp.]MDR3694259.1 type II toxin-antitoxin system VapC family toxin [Mucilaginibacter sp.]
MGAGYLLDTNTVIDFSSKKLPQSADRQVAFIIDDAPQISIINKIELLSVVNVPHQIVMFIEAASIIYLDEAIAEKTIDLRRKYKTKLPDAVIAATAIVNDLILVSHNTSDFRKINELKLIDSYSMKSETT